MLKILAVVLCVIIVLLVIAGLAISYLMRGTGEPKDLKAAKAGGDKLLARKDLRILVLTGHPDDVDWYLGGTAGKLARNGNLVVIGVGTSGEKGGNLPGLAKIREKEQQNAADIMGYSKVVFYRFPDRELEVNEAYKAKVRATIEKYGINTIFSFDTEKEGPVYHHSDHRAAGRAALEVGRELDQIKEIYLFYSSENNILVDTSEMVADKEKAMSAHKSQREHGRFRNLLGIFRVLFRGRDNNNQNARFNNTNAEIAAKVGIKACELFRKAK